MIELKYLAQCARPLMICVNSGRHFPSKLNPETFINTRQSGSKPFAKRPALSVHSKIAANGLLDLCLDGSVLCHGFLQHIQDLFVLLHSF